VVALIGSNVTASCNWGMGLVSAGTRLQVVTTNIGGNRHSRETPLDPPRVAREVRELLALDTTQPTIIAVQEATRIWFQVDQPLDSATLLAMELGHDFRAYFVPEIDSHTHPHRRAWNNTTYADAVRASEGNAIVTNLPLCPWPWSSAEANRPGHGRLDPLYTSISRATLYSTGDRNTQPRGMMVASLASPFGPVFAMATHLTTMSIDEDRLVPGEDRLSEAVQDRLTQIEQILRVVSELRAAEQHRGMSPRPIILAGDFNAQPASQELLRLETVFDRVVPMMPDGARWTHIKHKVEIDHIFIADPSGCFPTPIPGWVEQSDRVGFITDHRPVSAVIGE
jgi:endonuclease/exonuclease/phosphatase family metal-dependent hydrolase